MGLRCLITTIFHLYMYTIHRCALEAKAAIYARLSGGDGVREEEEEEEGEEPRYMVDFTRKIWEEVNTCYAYYVSVSTGVH